MMRAMAEPTPIGANKHKREQVHSFIRPTIEWTRPMIRSTISNAVAHMTNFLNSIIENADRFP